MTQGEQAAVAMVVGTVFGLGLWLFGRWQRGELRWAEVAVVAIGALLWAVVMAVLFTSESALTYLVPSAVLLIGGLYLDSRAGGSRWQRVVATGMAILGSTGMVGGIVRMVGSV